MMLNSVYRLYSESSPNNRHDHVNKQFRTQEKELQANVSVIIIASVYYSL